MLHLGRCGLAYALLCPQRVPQHRHSLRSHFWLKVFQRLQLQAAVFVLILITVAFSRMVIQLEQPARGRSRRTKRITCSEDSGSEGAWLQQQKRLMGAEMQLLREEEEQFLRAAEVPSTCCHRLWPGDQEWIEKSSLVSIEDPCEQDRAQPEVAGFVDDVAMYLVIGLDEVYGKDCCAAADVIEDGPGMCDDRSTTCFKMKKYGSLKSSVCNPIFLLVFDPRLARNCFQSDPKISNRPQP